jgi:hypothetical protein
MPHVATVALLLLSLGSPENRGSKAGGELTVTAVVMTSVSVTFSPDGRSSIVVANAPADEGSLISALAQSRPALHNKSSEHRLDNPHRGRRKPFALSK